MFKFNLGNVFLYKSHACKCTADPFFEGGYRMDENGFWYFYQILPNGVTISIYQTNDVGLMCAFLNETNIVPVVDKE